MLRLYAATFDIEEKNKKYQIEHRKGMELLLRGLKELYSLSFCIEELEKEMEYGEHGKPFLRNHREIHFNISHCEGMAVCLFAEGEVGVDVERIAEFREAVIYKVLTKAEQEVMAAYEGQMWREMFYRFWTLKECYLKQSGKGFTESPQNVSFTIERYGETYQIGCTDERVCFWQNKVKGEFILSVCSEKPERIEMQWENEECLCVEDTLEFPAEYRKGEMLD